MKHSDPRHVRILGVYTRVRKNNGPEKALSGVGLEAEGLSARSAGALGEGAQGRTSRRILTRTRLYRLRALSFNSCTVATHRVGGGGRRRQEQG